MPRLNAVRGSRWRTGAAELALDHVLGAALEPLHLVAQLNVAALHDFELVLNLGTQPLQLGLLAGHQCPLTGHTDFHLPHLVLGRLFVFP